MRMQMTSYNKLGIWCTLVGHIPGDYINAKDQNFKPTVPWLIAYAWRCAVRPPYNYLSYRSFEDHMIFLRSSVYHILPEFHTRLKPSATFQFNFSLAKVGRTSYDELKVMRDCVDDTLLATNYMQTVCVSKLTRRSAQLPDWFTGLYVSHGNHQTPQYMDRLGDKPAKIFKHKIQPPSSDTDENNHISSTAYIKYTEECAYTAAENNAYPSFTNDLTRYRIKTIGILYMAEALADDVITIETWEDGENRWKLNFVMKKNDKDELCHCSFEYYDFIESNL
ncbi:uncharacterized protein [Ptychodera flava]|uniref:uncharacterized protein isoform X2 n=1 Tax=Ptychodera flava TaxID=63121 RepID=UPI00396AB178